MFEKKNLKVGDKVFFIRKLEGVAIRQKDLENNTEYEIVELHPKFPEVNFVKLNNGYWVLGREIEKTKDVLN